MVRAPGGDLSVDLRGKAPGRGAYVCPEADCLDKGVREGSIAKALERPIDDATATRLQQELAAGAEQRRSGGGR